MSRGREDVLQTSNENYRLQFKKAESRAFNTTTTEQYPQNTRQYFHFINSEAGKEVSVAAVGFYNRSFMTLEDPQGSSTSVNVGNSQSFKQSFMPIVLEQQGNYLLEISSGSNFSANFDLTVVDLEEAEAFTLVPDDVVSLTGTIRMSGDIDRFDFIPDTGGTVIITLRSADTNGIDDSGNPRIQVRNPDTNGLTSSVSEDANPDGEDLYIWEGNITGENDYRIHIWDQEAITSGDFELTVEFTPNP